MATKKSAGAGRTRKKKPAAGKTAGSRAGLVSRLLKKVENKLETEDVKVSYGDYIRLLQLKKEIDEEQPREVRVEWVEPTSEDDTPAA